MKNLAPRPNPILHGRSIRRRQYGQIPKPVILPAIRERPDSGISSKPNRKGKHSVKNRKITLLTLCAIAATVGALWLTNGAVTPKEATWADAAAEA
jgi:hypothetical protein